MTRRAHTRPGVAVTLADGRKLVGTSITFQVERFHWWSMRRCEVAYMDGVRVGPIREMRFV